MNRPRAPHLVFAEPLEARRLMADASTLWHNVAELSRLDELATMADAPTGRGQLIAVVDSGIDYNHPALGGGIGPDHKVIGGLDFVDSDFDPMDDDGHGTAVAGVLAADEFTVSGRTMRGVAPDAKLMALRVYRSGEPAKATKIEEALSYLLDQIDDDGLIDGLRLAAVNLSLGTGKFESPTTTSVYADEIDRLADAGVVVVASSGNEGTEDGFGINYPAAHPRTVGVAATDEFGTISEFSERGALVDVVAPGERVPALGLNGGFVFAAGTSFATPFVSGSAPLVFDADPAATLGDYRSILAASGSRNVDGDDEFGATTGRTFAQLDLHNLAATAMARRPDPTDPGPGTFGNGNALAVDGEGVAHFAWFDSKRRTLRYASRDIGGQWSAAQTVDASAPEMGHYVSIAVDEFDRPAIAYFDGTNGDLRYAVARDGGWRTELLDGPGSTGLYPSLVFDADNSAAVAYYRKSSGDLRVIRQNAAGGWDGARVDTTGDAGRFVALQVAPNQRLAMAYAAITGGALRYAAETEVGSYNAGVVDNGLAGGTGFLDLDFDRGNFTPVISYYDAFFGDLKLATRRDEAWAFDKVADRGAVGLYTQVFTDDRLRTNILFYDRRKDTLERAVMTKPGVFSTETIYDDGGRYISAAVGPRGVLFSHNVADDLQLRVGELPMAFA